MCGLVPCCVGRLPELLGDRLKHRVEEILLLVSGGLARGGGWAKYCSATGQNFKLMLTVFAYSITWKPVSRCTVLMPAINAVAGVVEAKGAICVQDLEADGLVLLVSRRKCA